MPTAAPTTPRLVVYFSDGTTPLSDITTRPYTDVIFAFVVPTSATDLTLMGAGGAFGVATGPDPVLQANVQMVQKAGKHVLLSFGGATISSQSYQGYAADVDSLVSHLANDWILPYGFDGIDIDFEDSQAFMSGATYSGVDFLTSLTLGLAKALPGKIITHAPQTPYWDPAAQYGNAYTEVWKNTDGAITWINNQFYSNAPWDGTAALQETWYGNIAAIIGASRLVLGELVALGGSPPAPVLPDGESLTGIVQNLRQTFGASLGGAMGWEFHEDTNGEWSTAMAAALGLGASSGSTRAAPAACSPGASSPLVGAGTS
jgi:chitinase